MNNKEKGKKKRNERVLNSHKISEENMKYISKGKYTKNAKYCINIVVDKFL
jgi:hypothetical protein